MSTFSFPGGSSTFVPDATATNGLTIQFTRNPSAFPINRYAQYVTVNETAGKYIEIDSAAARRISSGYQYVWPDGEDAPVGKGYGFKFNPFACTRYSYPFTLGWLAQQQAEWDITSSHMGIVTQLLMTWRTTALRNIVATQSLWPTANKINVTSAIGNWNGSTLANSYIRKTCDAARNVIIQATNGVVKSDDMVLVIDPGTAKIIAESGEYLDTLKQSPYAFGLVGNNVQFDQYGLPPRLFGFTLVVEDTPLSTNIEGATESTSFLYTGVTDPGDSTSLGNCVMFCSRPGSLMGYTGAPSFSTNTLFFQEENTVELMPDANNRRTLGRVSTNFDPRITAPVSGVFCNHVWS